MVAHMKKIEELYEKTLELQEELNDLIESFIENPTVVNKKQVKEKSAEYNKVKNSMVYKISDYWCKYE